jgi:hypothetical protein
VFGADVCVRRPEAKVEGWGHRPTTKLVLGARGAAWSWLRAHGASRRRSSHHNTAATAVHARAEFRRGFANAAVRLLRIDGEAETIGRRKRLRGTEQRARRSFNLSRSRRLPTGARHQATLTAARGVSWPASGLRWDGRCRAPWAGRLGCAHGQH